MWNSERREVLRAELDAAMFYIYGVERDDVDYILDTFSIVRRRDEAAHGEYRTKRVILERYDAIAKANSDGTEYETTLDPPSGGRVESAEVGVMGERMHFGAAFVHGYIRILVGGCARERPREATYMDDVLRSCAAEGRGRTWRVPHQAPDPRARVRRPTRTQMSAAGRNGTRGMPERPSNDFDVGPTSDPQMPQVRWASGLLGDEAPTVTAGREWHR